MLNRINEVVKRNKTLVQNFSYLSLFQLFNMIIPLLVYPYLIRVLGNELYGLVIYAQAIVGYFAILVGFGFNISATKEISVHRDNKEKLNEVVSSIFIIKGLLFILSFFFFFIFINLSDNANQYKALYYITFYLCLYEWLFPIWYFQGIEKMKYITYINIVSRSIFLILIFFLIKNSDDYLLFPIISGLGSILACGIALFIIFKKHKVYLSIPKIKILKYYFKESIPIFSSNLSLKIYLSSNKVIIGSLFGMQEVAFYDLGEKILNLLKIPISTVSQVLFPKMANLFDKKMIIFLIKISFVFTVGMTFLFEIYAEEIITIFAGKEMIGAVDAVGILILSITPVVLSNLIGVQTLLSNGYNKQFFIVVFTSFCLYVLYIISCYFMNILNIYTICYSYLIIEIYMLIHFSFLVYKFKLLHNPKTELL